MNHLIQVWSILDKFYYHCSRLEYVNRQKQNIFRIKLLTYHGESLTLSDGTVIHEHDVLLKIHLHNCSLLREMQDLESELQRAFYVYHRVENSLPQLAEYISNHPKANNIKGIIGITLLTRGVKRLGFDVKEISNLFYKVFKMLFLTPMFIILHPNVKDCPRKKGVLVPKFLVMSKEKLLEKYL